MLHWTKLLDIFVLIQGGTAVVGFGAPNGAVGASVLVKLTRAEGVLDTFDAFVNLCLGTGHVDVVDMFGCKEALASNSSS